MCGLSGVLGPSARPGVLDRMVEAQRHRGPDGTRVACEPTGDLALGHNRLAIIDPATGADQPRVSRDGRWLVAFNGEIYNYRELRADLRGPWLSDGDTEVLVEAIAAWGPVRAAERSLGMFAFLAWDRVSHELWAIRDRFGVKPLYLATLPDGSLAFASELGGLFAAGVRPEPDTVMWATFLRDGTAQVPGRTFWTDIVPVEPGGALRASWSGGAATVEHRRWYDLPARIEGADERSDDEVAEEYLALLAESIALRFRSDVPVGINVSGGLDSSALLASVDLGHGEAPAVPAFTFVTGDDRYDELPWVRQLLDGSAHRLVVCPLAVAEVPDLAAQVAAVVAEPYGGIPTLAYATLFRRAREEGVLVLLDGQGIDEQWAGYDYYRSIAAGGGAAPVVQGAMSSAVRPACLAVEFAGQALDVASVPDGGEHLGPLRGAQLRDITDVKLPRALRYNDRVSMLASCELREPFLDHRLVELALRQPDRRKVRGDQGKVFMRELVGSRLPGRVANAPKRPVQTPQREWLRGPLAEWSAALIDQGLAGIGSGWLDAAKVHAELASFRDGKGDNSHHIWQWMSIGEATQIRAGLR